MNGFTESIRSFTVRPVGRDSLSTLCVLRSHLLKELLACPEFSIWIQKVPAYVIFPHYDNADLCIDFPAINSLLIEDPLVAISRHFSRFKVDSSGDIDEEILKLVKLDFRGE